MIGWGYFILYLILSNTPCIYVLQSSDEDKGWTKNFSATYESRIKVLHIFQQPHSYRLRDITLIWFLDNSYVKIFHKHWGGVKIKVIIFIDIFEVKDQPLCMGFALNWWWQTFFRYSSQKPRKNNTTKTKFTTQKWFSTTPERAGPTREGGYWLQKPPWKC